MLVGLHAITSSTGIDTGAIAVAPLNPTATELSQAMNQGTADIMELPVMSPQLEAENAAITATVPVPPAAAPVCQGLTIGNTCVSGTVVTVVGAAALFVLMIAMMTGRR